MRSSLRSTLAVAALLLCAAAVSPPGATASSMASPVALDRHAREMSSVAEQYRIVPATLVLSQYVVAEQLQVLTAEVASSTVQNPTESTFAGVHQVREIEVPPGGLSTGPIQLDTSFDCMALLNGAGDPPPLRYVALHRTEYRSRRFAELPPLTGAST